MIILCDGCGEVGDVGGWLGRRLGGGQGGTGVCEKTLRTCSPAPDLVFWKLRFQRVLFSGGVFFSQTPVGRWGANDREGREVGNRGGGDCTELYRCMTLPYHVSCTDFIIISTTFVSEIHKNNVYIYIYIYTYTCIQTHICMTIALVAYCVFERCD